MSIKYDKILGKMREADSGSGPAPEPYVLPVATDSALGGVKVGNGIDAQTDGTISVTPYSLPMAGSDTLGGVKIGSGVDVATDGTMSVTPYSLPIAGADVLGGIKIGSGLDISTTGTMSIALPVAAADVLGAIKVGSGLSIDSATGVLSASGGGSIPIATTSDVGGVKIGNGLSVAADGTLKPNWSYFNFNFWKQFLSSGNQTLAANTKRGRYYLIIAIGGGGGGAAGNVIGSTYASGGGGGAGGLKALLLFVPAGTQYYYVNMSIGAAGLGGRTTNNSEVSGTNGGNTSVTIGNGTGSLGIFAAYGGKGGGANAGPNDLLCAQGGDGELCDTIYGSGAMGSSGIAYMVGSKGTSGANGYVSDVTSTLFGGDGGNPGLSFIWSNGQSNYTNNKGKGGRGGGTTSTGWESGSDGEQGAVIVFFNNNDA